VSYRPITNAGQRAGRAADAEAIWSALVEAGGSVRATSKATRIPLATLWRAIDALELRERLSSTYPPEARIAAGREAWQASRAEPEQIDAGPLRASHE
jgi:hypothetical protein